eukprot:scaffold28182_cov126-Isochrysis_galbana.AAC.6
MASRRLPRGSGSSPTTSPSDVRLHPRCYTCRQLRPPKAEKRQGIRSREATCCAADSLAPRPQPARRKLAFRPPPVAPPPLAHLAGTRTFGLCTAAALPQHRPARGDQRSHHARSAMLLRRDHHNWACVRHSIV